MTVKRYRNKYHGATVRTANRLGPEWLEVDDDAPLVLVAESGKVLNAEGDQVHPANQEELREEVKRNATGAARRRVDKSRKGSDSE